MHIQRAALFFLLAVLLAGCRNPYLVAQRFEDSSRKYGQMVRWHEYEKACDTFAAPSIREDCLMRARAAEGVSMADYRVKGTEVDREKGTATVRAEIDYYVLPSARLKTIEDVQQWCYEPVEGSEGWRIVTPLPAFR